MCEDLYIGFIDFMMKGRSLLDYTNLFFQSVYFTTKNFNTFSGKVLDKRLKQTKLRKPAIKNEEKINWFKLFSWQKFYRWWGFPKHACLSTNI